MRIPCCIFPMKSIGSWKIISNRCQKLFGHGSGHKYHVQNQCKTIQPKAASNPHSTFLKPLKGVGFRSGLEVDIFNHVNIPSVCSVFSDLYLVLVPYDLAEEQICVQITNSTLFCLVIIMYIKRKCEIAVFILATRWQKVRITPLTSIAVLSVANLQVYSFCGESSDTSETSETSIYN